MWSDSSNTYIKHVSILQWLMVYNDYAKNSPKPLDVMNRIDYQTYQNLLAFRGQLVKDSLSLVYADDMSRIFFEYVTNGAQDPKVQKFLLDWCAEDSGAVLSAESNMQSATVYTKWSTVFQLCSTLITAFGFNRYKPYEILYYWIIYGILRKDSPESIVALNERVKEGIRDVDEQNKLLLLRKYIEGAWGGFIRSQAESVKKYAKQSPTLQITNSIEGRLMFTELFFDETWYLTQTVATRDGCRESTQGIKCRKHFQQTGTCLKDCFVLPSGGCVSKNKVPADNLDWIVYCFDLPNGETVYYLYQILRRYPIVPAAKGEVSDVVTMIGPRILKGHELSENDWYHFTDIDYKSPYFGIYIISPPLPDALQPLQKGIKGVGTTAKLVKKLYDIFSGGRRLKEVTIAGTTRVGVHEGLWNFCSGIVDDLMTDPIFSSNLENLLALNRETGNGRIILVGTSFGGGISNCLFGVLSQRFLCMNTISVYASGSPRVGDDRYNKFCAPYDIVNIVRQKIVRGVVGEYVVECDMLCKTPPAGEGFSDNANMFFLFDRFLDPLPVFWNIQDEAEFGLWSQVEKIVGKQRYYRSDLYTAEVAELWPEIHSIATYSRKNILTIDTTVLTPDKDSKSAKDVANELGKKRRITRLMTTRF